MTFTPVEEDGSPRDGKSALGSVQESGVFELKTYEERDGAIIGWHRVYYSAPEDESLESETVTQTADGGEAASSTDTADGTDGGIESQLEVSEASSIVEVKGGENNAVNVELVKMSSEEDEGDDDE